MSNCSASLRQRSTRLPKKAGIPKEFFDGVAGRMREAFPVTDALVEGEAMFSQAQIKQIIDITAAMCGDSLAERNKACVNG